jgi:hypothetical protein
MLARGLNPLTEAPIWVCLCSGIIGAIQITLGIAITYTGKYGMSDIDLIPERTIALMKEYS